MTTILAPTVVRYTMRHTLSGGHPSQNIVDVSLDVGPASTREDAINDFNGHINTFWQESIIAAVSNTVTFLGSHFIDLDNPSGLTGDVAPTAGKPTTGSGAFPPAAPNTSYLIHKLSKSARGQKQGRLYWAPVIEQDVGADGVIVPASATAFTNIFESFRNKIDTYSSLVVESAAWRTVHVHKPKLPSGKPNPDSSTWTWSSSTIDSVRCDPLAATQRRRLR